MYVRVEWALYNNTKVRKSRMNPAMISENVECSYACGYVARVTLASKRRSGCDAQGPSKQGVRIDQTAYRQLQTMLSIKGIESGSPSEIRFHRRGRFIVVEATGRRYRHA